MDEDTYTEKEYEKEPNKVLSSRLRYYLGEADA
jgi:hypothetical protein